MGKLLKYVAMAIGAAWACYWLLLEMVEDREGSQFNQVILFFVVTFGAVAIAWRWPTIGSVLFLAEAVAAVVHLAYHSDPRVDLEWFLFQFARMPLPPLAAGILLLLSRRHAPPPRRIIVV